MKYINHKVLQDIYVQNATELLVLPDAAFVLFCFVLHKMKNPDNFYN